MKFKRLVWKMDCKEHWIDYHISAKPGQPVPEVPEAFIYAYNKGIEYALSEVAKPAGIRSHNLNYNSMSLGGKLAMIKNRIKSKN